MKFALLFEEITYKGGKRCDLTGGVPNRVSHITPFFELSLVLLTTHAIGFYEVTKKDFCVLHFLQGKKAQNRPENQQN